MKEEKMDSSPTAFYAGPYDKEFDWVCSSLATACEPLGLQLWNVGDQATPGSNAFLAIHHSVANCTIGYAVITGLNPNVLYELGLLHALSKPTVILADKETAKGLPFDLRPISIVIYDSASRNEQELTWIAMDASSRVIRLSEDESARKALIKGEFVGESARNLSSAKLSPRRMNWDYVEEEARLVMGFKNTKRDELVQVVKDSFRGWEMTISDAGGNKAKITIDVNGGIQKIRRL